ncbi:hypothetical protein L7F22_036913 [Adiantum nelumboides]|nr:hypothetical protein [Adiantum nelumboides]
MLDQCFRYGLSTSKCRANTLLQYFGENLATAPCEICDVCATGPPPLENLTMDAEMLILLLSSPKCDEVHQRNHLWWRGFERVLADAGFLKEASPAGRSAKKLIVPHLRNPKLTADGQKFLDNRRTEGSVTFSVHPEGEMIQALLEPARAQHASKSCTRVGTRLGRPRDTKTATCKIKNLKETTSGEEAA